MEQKLEYAEIIVDKKYPIGYITINRPERRNALETAKGRTIQQMQQAFLEMRDDPEIRVFVVKGAGDNFCAGFDQSRPDQVVNVPPRDIPKAVEWVKTVDNEPWSRYGRTYSGEPLSNPEGQPLHGHFWFWEGLWNNPKPSIAQVHSYCLGAGLWTANLCDVVYATPDAVFAYPPIRDGASAVLGILPPWLLGRRMTMWMALTGQAITAQEAYNCGLITKIVPENEIEEAVDKLATSIARVPPATNMFSKRAINNYYENLGIDQAQRFASALVYMTENSAVPGHYFDYFQEIKEKGYTEGRKAQRAKWGYEDPVIERERARLKANKGKR